MTDNGFAAFHSLPAISPNFRAEADADFHRYGRRQKSSGKGQNCFQTSTPPLLYGAGRRMQINGASQFCMHFIHKRYWQQHTLTI